MYKSVVVSCLKPFYRGLFWGCSRVFHRIVAVRHWMYERGFLQQVKGELPVVSVGNILAGGCGKTSFTMLLAKHLPECAIVSRGYKGQKVSSAKQVSDLSTGDEPYLMARALPNIPVIVSRKREKGVALAKRLGRKLVLLDDGMQYLRLKKSYKIILLRAENLWGDYEYLPLGYLREEPDRIKEAHLIVIHGVENTEQSAECIRAVREKTGHNNIMTTKYSIDNQEAITGKPVGAFCGIGNPEGFFRLLEEAKCDIIHQRRLVDHTRMSRWAFRRFLADCYNRGAECVVCTEKDRIKYPQIGRELQSVRVCMEIIEGQKIFDNAIKTIRRLMSE